METIHLVNIPPRQRTDRLVRDALVLKIQLRAERLPLVVQSPRGQEPEIDDGRNRSGVQQQSAESLENRAARRSPERDDPQREHSRSQDHQRDVEQGDVNVVGEGS